MGRRQFAKDHMNIGENNNRLNQATDYWGDQLVKLLYDFKDKTGIRVHSVAFDWGDKNVGCVITTTLCKD